MSPIQNGCHFTECTFKCIFMKENVRIFIKISLKFVSKGPIDNIPALVQIMTCHLVGTKPLSEPMMVILLTHIHVYASLGLNELIPFLTNWGYVSFAPIYQFLSLYSFLLFNQLVCFCFLQVNKPAASWSLNQISPATKKPFSWTIKNPMDTLKMAWHHITKIKSRHSCFRQQGPFQYKDYLSWLLGFPL